MGWSAPSTINIDTSGGAVEVNAGTVNVENTPGGSLATTRGSAILASGQATAAAPLTLTVPVDPTVRGITLVAIFGGAVWAAGVSAYMTLQGSQSAIGYIGTPAADQAATVDLPENGYVLTVPVAAPLDTDLILKVTPPAGQGGYIEVWAVGEYDPISIVASQAINAQESALGLSPFLVAGSAGAVTVPLQVDGNGCPVLPAGVGSAYAEVGPNTTTTVPIPSPAPLIRGISWNYSGVPGSNGDLFITWGSFTLMRKRVIAGQTYDSNGVVPIPPGGIGPFSDLPSIGGDLTGTTTGELAVVVIY